MTDHLRPQDAALERLRALHQLKIDLSLDRMERLCAILKNRSVVCRPSFMSQERTTRDQLSAVT